MARTLTLERTKAQMDALIAQSLLNTQTYYKITDRGDRGLLFRAAAVNRLESDGIRYMLCPTTYAVGLDAYNNDWIGVWNATKQATATTGQLCIWNGLVWVAGETMDGNAPDTETSGWTVIPKASFTNHEYVEMVFGVTYDFENDWISKQWDGNGNVFGVGYDAFFTFYELDYVTNPIERCMWGYETSGNVFFGNTCAFLININATNIYNNTKSNYASSVNCNASFNDNCVIGEISNINNVNLLSGNTIRGNIKNIQNINWITNNHVASIDDVTGIGDIDISNNFGNYTISGTFDADVTDPVVDKTGTAEPTTTL